MMFLGSKMKTHCENCNEFIHRKPRLIRKYKHSFCDKDCYIMYRRQHPEEYNSNTKKDMSQLRKIKKMAEIIKESKLQKKASCP